MKNILLILMLAGVCSAAVANGPYVLIDTEGNPVRIKSFPSHWTPAVAAPQFDYRPLVYDREPDYDPATQKIAKSYAVERDRVRETYAVVPLSSDEIKRMDRHLNRVARLRAVHAKLKAIGFTDEEIIDLAALLESGGIVP